MPTLHLKSGQQQVCEYSKASELQNALDGNPCDRAFTPEFLNIIQKIDHIEFEPLPKKLVHIPTKDIVRDDKLHEIMDSTSLKGYEKFKAIGDYLKHKHLDLKVEV